MAAQHTIDQFDLTTKFPLKPHTRRAMVFLDSLSVVSTASVAFVFISFFQPLRARYTHLRQSREEAEALLEVHKGTSEDFFKIWPHDKSYMFSADHKAGLAYKVERGVAIVVGDPFWRQEVGGPPARAVRGTMLYERLVAGICSFGTELAKFLQTKRLHSAINWRRSHCINDRLRG